MSHLSGHGFAVVEQKMLLLLAVLALDFGHPSAVHIVQHDFRLGALAEAEETLQNTHRVVSYKRKTVSERTRDGVQNRSDAALTIVRRRFGAGTLRFGQLSTKRQHGAQLEPLPRVDWLWSHVTPSWPPYWLEFELHEILETRQL